MHRHVFCVGSSVDGSCSVLLGLSRFGSVLGSVRFGSVRFGSVRFGSVRSGPVRSGPVRSGPVRSGPVRSGSIVRGRQSHGRWPIVGFEWSCKKVAVDTICFACRTQLPCVCACKRASVRAYVSEVVCQRRRGAAIASVFHQGLPWCTYRGRVRHARDKTVDTLHVAEHR